VRLLTARAGQAADEINADEAHRGLVDRYGLVAGPNGLARSAAVSAK
jgi:hypothetical protein